jgi:CBS domain-containing protein/mannitol/fructose-specific phosphotransferase system IIA component (Ntr-type)
MHLLQLLPPEHVIVPLEAADVRVAVDSLLEQLERAGAVRRSETLHERIRSDPLREVVGISDDVLLPHYRHECVQTLTLALGIAPAGLDAEGPDRADRPRVVALVLAPPDAPHLYLQAISTLARLLRQPGIVDALVAQPDPGAVLALPQLQNVPVQPSLAVRDVMVHRIHSVAPDTPLRDTMGLMLRRRLRAVPVVGPKGEVLGMITDSDLMRALLPQIPRIGAPDEDGVEGPLSRPVRQFMTRSVLCVSEDLGINEVASMMINKDVEQVPVVHEGTITGMISRGDIIRKLFGPLTR